MANPRRYDIEGHIHFVTSTCYKRVPIFLYDLCNTSAIEAVKFYRKKHNFNLIGYTIMPDHLHMLIQLGNTSKISDVIRDIKHAVAFKVLRTLKAGQQARPTQIAKPTHVRRNLMIPRRQTITRRVRQGFSPCPRTTGCYADLDLNTQASEATGTPFGKKGFTILTFLLKRS